MFAPRPWPEQYVEGGLQTAPRLDGLPVLRTTGEVPKWS